MINTSTNWQFGSYENDRNHIIKIAEDDPLYKFSIGAANGSADSLQPIIGGADHHVVIGYGFDLS